MSSRNKYLDRLKGTLPPQKGIGDEPSKISKTNFDIFETAHPKGFSPPLDAEGVPCGGCPSCNQGEFWRWPKFHPKHDPR